MTPAPDEKGPAIKLYPQDDGSHGVTVNTIKPTSPKPCPACGAKGELSTFDAAWYAHCTEEWCITGPTRNTPDEALAAWDAMPRRTDHPLGAVRLLLRAALRTMGERLDDTPARRGGAEEVTK